MFARCGRVCLAGAIVAATLVGGCGSSSSKSRQSAHTTGNAAASSPAKQPVCPPTTRTVAGRFFAISPNGIAAAASTGNNSMPQCSYTAHLADGKRVVAVANIDTAPQAYFRLERAAVENGQAFTSGKPPPPPQSIGHLGMEAFWFPVQTEVMTTDGVRLVTVSVKWNGVPDKRKQALAVALSRTYLRAPYGRANGYPSS